VLEEGCSNPASEAMYVLVNLVADGAVFRVNSVSSARLAAAPSSLHEIPFEMVGGVYEWFKCRSLSPHRTHRRVGFCQVE
jgi:hypothetical protein